MTWVGNRFQIDPKHIRFEDGVFTLSREGYDTIAASINHTDIKYMGIPNVCFSLTEPGDNREEMFAAQRMERGFDNSETWSLDGTIARFVLPRLKVFTELTCGYPASLTEKGWNRRLDIMIRAVELYMKFDRNASEEATLHRGAKLFFIWYGALWW